MLDGPRAGRTGPRRPTGRRLVSRSANPACAFATLTCTRIERGGELDEGYRVPGAPRPLEFGPAPDAMRAGA